MGRRKKSSGGGGAKWMDTYGDMVTLLLCFFVLLYSMSDINKEKFEILVKAFNPSAAEISQIVIDSNEQQGEDPLISSEQPEQIDDFDELFYTLSQYIEQNNLQNDIEVSKGDGFAFITFRNNIFFDGDSYDLKQEGKETLDILAGALNNVTDNIKEISVLGHTSQASPDIPNEPVSDRFLSSNRATEVLLYLQQKNFIDPTKLVASGYGQFRPISKFDTAEERARNRRVEILITKTDDVERSLEEYYAESESIKVETILDSQQEAAQGTQ